MKQILLTGGSGFIGKNILESFLVEKYDIVAPSHAELDLLETRSADAFFKGKTFDCVLHACAKPGHRNAKDPSRLLYSNLRMFENLERHKDKFGKFLNFGSGAVYDQSRDISGAREADLFARVPADEHGFCKYAIAKQIEKLPNFTDLIVFGVFGKYEDFEIRFISNAVCKALFGLPITLRQNRRFSYIDVGDLMPILEHFIEREAELPFYNIAGDGYVELAEVARWIREISGRDIPIQVAAEGYGLDYYADNARLRGHFKMAQFTALKASIAKLYRYYADRADAIDKELLMTDK